MAVSRNTVLNFFLPYLSMAKEKTKKGDGIIIQAHGQQLRGELFEQLPEMGQTGQRFRPDHHPRSTQPEESLGSFRGVDPGVRPERGVQSSGHLPQEPIVRALLHDGVQVGHIEGLRSGFGDQGAAERERRGAFAQRAAEKPVTRAVSAVSADHHSSEEV